MDERRALFSIKDGNVHSLGAQIVLGKRGAEGSFPLNVYPEVFFTPGTNGNVCIKGAFHWVGGTLGDLWNSQVETARFILNNYKLTL